MRGFGVSATIDSNSNRNGAVNIREISNKINTCIYFVYTMGVFIGCAACYFTPVF